LKSFKWFPLRSEAARRSPPQSDYTLIGVTPRTVDQTARGGLVLDEVLTRGNYLKYLKDFRLKAKA